MIETSTTLMEKPRREVYKCARIFSMVIVDFKLYERLLQFMITDPSPAGLTLQTDLTTCQCLKSPVHRPLSYPHTLQ